VYNICYIVLLLLLLSLVAAFGYILQEPQTHYSGLELALNCWRKRPCIVSSLSVICVFLSWLAVTIARAIELKHSSSLVSALAFETAQLYTTAGIASHGHTHKFY